MGTPSRGISADRGGGAYGPCLYDCKIGRVVGGSGPRDFNVVGTCGQIAWNGPFIYSSVFDVG